MDARGAKAAKQLGLLAVRAKLKARIHFDEIDVRIGAPYGTSMAVVGKLLSGDGKISIDMIGKIFFAIDGSALKFQPPITQ